MAQAIVDAGLQDYYRHRTEPAHTAQEQVPAFLEGLHLYDHPQVQERFVSVAQDDVREASLILEGITCAACVWLNERHVGALPGILEFRINFANHRARVRWDDSRIHLSRILEAITSIGYLAHPYDPTRHQEVAERERRLALRRIAVAGLGTMQVMMFAVALYVGAWSGMERPYRVLFEWVSLVVATPVVVYAARPFFLSAWSDLRARRLGMDVPVALAIGAAFLTSLWATVSGRGQVYYDSVSMFTFFLLSGRYLEMAARQRATAASESLVRLLPAMAHRIGPDGEHAVPVAELALGDRLRVRPGETLPTDGEVIEGRSSADESLLTGEALPQPKGPGDLLIGGAVNVEGPLTMRVTRLGEDTVVAGILRLLDRAQSQRPRIARLADRVAAWFVAGLLVLAALVAFWWWRIDPENAFWITLSVLVVTCPCALSLATPAAVTAASGELACRGLLTTRGHALETLARATHIVFDKTGTLTRGRLRLGRIESPRGWSREEVLRIASALEVGSEHPVARAIRAEAASPAADELRSTPGSGVEGWVGGRRYRLGRPRFVAEIARAEAGDVVRENQAGIILGDPSGPLAVLHLIDRPRLEARAAVDALRSQGLEIWLLSGDAARPVSDVARELGIAHAESGLTPAAKLARVEALQAEGAIVTMVGDGVNDAPVLAGAQVSVAMGEATELAQAHADMVLFSNDLDALPEGVAMARRMLGIVRQNLAWAVLYNAVAVPLAAMGHVQPWMAAIGMSGSSLLVVLNALRLRRRAAIGEDHESPKAVAEAH